MLRIILLVLAAICFFLLVIKVTVGTLLLLPLGLLFWVLADLFAGYGPPLTFVRQQPPAA